MIAIDRNDGDFLYAQVADLINDQVRAGALRPGDKLPSLRRMSDQLEVSVPTVRQAYLELERRGRIEARPKSGYYIQPQRQSRLVKVGCKTCKPMPVSCRHLIDRVYDGIHRHGILPLGIANPCIAVLGLNPHAGESGHLGREEIDTMIPVLDALRAEGMDLLGPLPADTAFNASIRAQADAYLAMYHDQGLPVLKFADFGNAVNVTLGLPIVRTSVDHGTALDIAGTGKANAGSLMAALTLALQAYPRGHS